MACASRSCRRCMKPTAQQLSTNIPIGQWMDTRGALAAQGLSNQGAGIISYTAGRPPVLSAAQQLAAAPSHRLLAEGRERTLEIPLRPGQDLHPRRRRHVLRPDRPAAGGLYRRELFRPLYLALDAAERLHFGAASALHRLQPRFRRRPKRRCSSSPRPRPTSPCRIRTPSPSPVRWTTG